VFWRLLLQKLPLQKFKYDVAKVVRLLSEFGSELGLFEQAASVISSFLLSQRSEEVDRLNDETRILCDRFSPRGYQPFW
jgi:hypothetical protein